MSNKIKEIDQTHNYKVFFLPWISPIWLKIDDLKVVQQSDTKYKTSPIKYSVNMGKDLPVLFSLSTFKAFSYPTLTYTDFVKYFFTNYFTLINEIDVTHESFSIAKDLQGWHINDFSEIIYPTFKRMTKIIANDQKKKKLKFKTHLDIKNYFKSIYLHAITWDENNKKALRSELIDEFHRKYMFFIAHSETYGLPIGLNVTNLIAEFEGRKITLAIKCYLEQFKMKFRIYRYVDDIIIYHNRKITFNMLSEINNIIYTKYGYSFHTNDDKIALNNYKGSQSIWPAYYRQAKKMWSPKDAPFKNNLTSKFKKISMFMFNEKTFIFEPNKKYDKKLKIYFKYIKHFLKDRTISVREKLSLIKTPSLLKFCGYLNTTGKLNHKYGMLFVRTIDILFKFYIKNIDSLFSEDRNNLGILIYLVIKINEIREIRFELDTSVLAKIKHWIQVDSCLLLLISSLYYYNKDSYENFINFIKNSYYFTHIEWPKNALQEKNIIKWLSIDADQIYNDETES